MGTYTTSQEFYKPDADEFVDVESQINYNLRRADERVKAIVEWQYTDEPFITGVLPREQGYKYFKGSTNSLFTCPTTNGAVQQASNLATTDAWAVTSILSLPAGYKSVDLSTSRLSYTKEGFDGVVRWRGLMKLNDGFDQIPLNTNIVVMTIAADITPARSKYFYVHGGIASGGFSCIRLLFTNTGDVQINRMGINQGTATERFISFNDVVYPTNDG